jgi:3-hydroxyacyl-CoA dehydrogenase
VVEVVPGPQTDPEIIETVRFWLTELRQVPIILKKEVPGHVVGRLIAAVWRESIQLVLDGVVDVQTMDAAVQLGPGLAWATSGPHLNRALDAGPEGIAAHIAERLGNFEPRWQSLAKWDQLSTEDRQKIQRAIEKAYGNRIDDLRTARRFRLIQELDIASEGPTGGWQGELSIVKPPEPR